MQVGSVKKAFVIRIILGFIAVITTGAIQYPAERIAEWLNADLVTGWIVVILALVIILLAIVIGWILIQRDNERNTGGYL